METMILVIAMIVATMLLIVLFFVVPYLGKWPGITTTVSLTEGLGCYLASEGVLAKDWDTSEEDEAWKDL